MVKTEYIKEKSYYLILYSGKIEMPDIEKIDFELDRITFIKENKFDVLVDFSKARISDTSVINKIAESTNRNLIHYKQIYIFGMNSFMQIMFKAYLLLSNDQNLHVE